jgi:hypothetical protein
MVCVETNSLSGSSFASATACCTGVFHFKWDTCIIILLSSVGKIKKTEMGAKCGRRGKNEKYKFWQRNIKIGDGLKDVVVDRKISHTETM